MSKNRHAYKDYHGPRLPGCKIQHPAKPEPDNDDEDEHPLRGLVWAEGDSLAPPCGSSVPLIHAMLEFASVDQDDVLYDMGCGDGRVLLEGLVKKKCRQCVGVEIEQDLVDRGQELIAKLPETWRSEGSPQDGMASSRRIQIVQGDLREVLKELVGRLADNEHDAETDEERPYHDLPMPTIICLYLLPEGIAEIEEDLMKILPHVRIVSFEWGLKEVRPIQEKDVYDMRTKASTTLYLYTKECFERLKGFEYMLTVYNHGH